MGLSVHGMIQALWAASTGPGGETEPDPDRGGQNKPKKTGNDPYDIDWPDDPLPDKPAGGVWDPGAGVDPPSPPGGGSGEWRYGGDWFDSLTGGCNKFDPLAGIPKLSQAELDRLDLIESLRNLRQTLIDAWVDQGYPVEALELAFIDPGSVGPGGNQTHVGVNTQTAFQPDATGYNQLVASKSGFEYKETGWEPGTFGYVHYGLMLMYVAGAFNSPASAWPGDDPGKGPSGTEWRGRPGSVPGDGHGNYYNPTTGESFRPDLNHPEPIGPHWDYRDSDGNWHRIRPDGEVVPK
jgi:hypothetical protein